MSQTRTGRLLCQAALVLLVAAFATADRPVWGAKGDASVKGASAKKSHRLPAYYGSVVTEKQREVIYKIQDEYQPKIAALTEQLKALKNEQEAKIAAVLTEQQKKRVEEAAKRKHEAKKTQSAKPTQALPDPPVTAPKPSK
jgi:hypothetical protein